MCKFIILKSSFKGFFLFLIPRLSLYFVDSYILMLYLHITQLLLLYFASNLYASVNFAPFKSHKIFRHRLVIDFQYQSIN